MFWIYSFIIFLSFYSLTTFVLPQNKFLLQFHFFYFKMYKNTFISFPQKKILPFNQNRSVFSLRCLYLINELLPFKKCSTPFPKSKTAFRKSWTTFRKSYIVFRKSETAFSKSSNTFSKSCTTFSKILYYF